MENVKFRIVFEKLDQAMAEDKEPGTDALVSGPTLRLADVEEAREISELRRLASELSEPEPRYFTGN